MRRIILVLLFLAAALGPLPTTPARATEVACTPSVLGASTSGGTPPSLRTAAQNHALNVGSAVRTDALVNDGNYRNTLAREFNMLTPGNEMKWDSVHPQQGLYDFCRADQQVVFGQRYGLVVRGHTLVWHSQNPLWLTSGSYSREQMIAILRDHIFTVVGHFRTKFPGQVVQWDVANEVVADCSGPAACPLRDTIWLQRIGPDYVDLAFQFAREADPSALLFLNDYADTPGPKFDGVYSIAASMKQRGVPIDGVGLQYHIGGSWGDPSEDDVRQNLSRIAGLGLQAAVTELDVGMGIKSALATPQQWQLDLQADRYHRVVNACLSVAACRTLSVWGFTDKYTWRSPDQPCLYDKAVLIAPKPAYYAVRDRLLEP